MNVSVRFGEIGQTLLSRWPVGPQKPAGCALPFRYLTIGGRQHLLMMRESLLSVCRSWSGLPRLTIVSDGSWGEEEFRSVFHWWPGASELWTRTQVLEATRGRGDDLLAEYASASPYGLKLASIVHAGRQTEPVLFVDADILWFGDPKRDLGDPHEWGRPRGIRESHCYQRRDLALRYCPAVLEPPFVNGGILAFHGEFLDRETFCSMVDEALTDPREGSYEQTIIATAVHKGCGLLPEKVCLTEFEDRSRFRYRNMREERFLARHYVNWMRHLFYREALRERFCK